MNKNRSFLKKCISDGFNELGWSPDIPNENGEMKFGPDCHEVNTLVDKLEKFLIQNEIYKTALIRIESEGIIGHSAIARKALKEGKV